MWLLDRLLKRAKPNASIAPRPPNLNSDTIASLREAFRLGDCQDAASRARAAAMYVSVARKVPECPIAWFNLGVVQARSGEWKKACRSFSKAAAFPSTRALAAFARLKLMVEHGKKWVDADLPEEYRGGNRADLGVHGPGYNAANELRNRGYSCVVEPGPLMCRIRCAVGQTDYAIVVEDVAGALVKYVLRREDGKISCLGGTAGLRETERQIAELDVGRLPIVQAPVPQGSGVTGEDVGVHAPLPPFELTAEDLVSDVPSWINVASRTGSLGWQMQVHKLWHVLQGERNLKCIIKPGSAISTSERVQAPQQQLVEPTPAFLVDVEVLDLDPWYADSGKRRGDPLKRFAGLPLYTQVKAQAHQVAFGVAGTAFEFSYEDPQHHKCTALALSCENGLGADEFRWWVIGFAGSDTFQRLRAAIEKTVFSFSLLDPHPGFSRDELLMARKLAGIWGEEVAAYGMGPFPAPQKAIAFGRRLYKTGGVALMRKVASLAQGMYPHMRGRIDNVWEGIGGWPME